MNMKRQISVSIFLAILVLALAWLYIKFSNETSPNEKELSTENDVSNEPAITISQELEKKAFYLLVEDGKIVVYQGDTEKKYMETSITFDTLPEELKDRINKGISFQTEAELYDFLESYSS